MGPGESHIEVTCFLRMGPFLDWGAVLGLFVYGHSVSTKVSCGVKTHPHNTTNPQPLNSGVLEDSALNLIIRLIRPHIETPVLYEWKHNAVLFCYIIPDHMFYASFSFPHNSLPVFPTAFHFLSIALSSSRKFTLSSLRSSLFPYFRLEPL